MSPQRYAWPAYLTVALLLWSGLTPAARAATDDTPIPDTATCTDTDGGVFSKIKGTISLSNSHGNIYAIRTDSCSGSDGVIEVSCRLDTQGWPIIQEFVPCSPSFTCHGGACVPRPIPVIPPPPTPSPSPTPGNLSVESAGLAPVPDFTPKSNFRSPDRSCVDSDGGVYYETAGTVTVPGRRLIDRCAADGVTLTEYYCDQRPVGYATTASACPQGCANGACRAFVPPPAGEGCYVELAITERKPQHPPCAPPASLIPQALPTSSGVNPQAAVDGHPETVWDAPAVGRILALTLDLGGRYCLTGVAVSLPPITYRPVEVHVGERTTGGAHDEPDPATVFTPVMLDLDGSMDGRRWTSLTRGWTLTHQGAPVEASFPQTSLRYLRLSHTRLPGETLPGLKLAELSLLSRTPPTEPVRFTLATASMRYGDYAHLVRPYYPEDGATYILRTYDRGHRLLNSFALASSRFLIAEDFSGPKSKGELIEFDEGTISAVIPYRPDLGSLAVEVEGTRTLLALPLAGLRCERTCKLEGEPATLPTERCCQGFRPVNVGTAYVCVACGDTHCTVPENGYNCPEDCQEPGGP